MAQNKGNLLRCLYSITSHIAPHRANRLVFSGNSTIGGISQKFDLVSHDVNLVITQVQKIRDLAISKGYDDITAILEENLEYGHDI